MKKLLAAAMLFMLNSWSCFSADTPRAEYPRPQFEREQWVNLNGTWTFDFDFGKSGKDRRLQSAEKFDKNITVPFCPESKLSGVGYTDFIEQMWYQRNITIPSDWNGKKIFLNFGAVDYCAEIYVDGKFVQRHFGGSSSFAVDLTRYVTPGKTHNLVVFVQDDLRSGLQTGGKQCGNYYSGGCSYTRTTGIWQTVWMEAVSADGLKSVFVRPDIDQKQLVIEPEFYNESANTLEITLKDRNKTVAKKSVNCANSSVVVLPVKNMKLWSPEDPFLYDLVYQVKDAKGNVLDEVKSYAGMRKVHTANGRFYLNNQPYFQRLVLDQGFYPEGIWTAPSDEDLKNDIVLGKEAGFNGARLHQKVFEERFHYWADKLGYLTWGESASWGLNTSSPEAARNFLTEWEEVVVRDRNHPSIIVWTPFNETWDRPNDNEQARQHDRFISDVYKLSHNLDYRPVNDASGNYHVMTDIWSVHHYAQSGEEMKKRLEIKDGKLPQKDVKKEVPYEGQPYFVDEYGGIKWVHGKQFAENTWGYGQGPKTLDEFYARLKDITFTVLEFDFVAGYCYTQLTDVEQEQNGIYNYDRTPKFDMEIIKSIFNRLPEKK